MNRPVVAASGGTTRLRVLLVDDEPSILAVLSRTLRRNYHTVAVTSGAAGLAAIEADGPFAVVVSDMRMPGMDGAQFLARAAALSPDTVRVLLTGQADVPSAVSAVNDGQIFRFLEKPCPSERFEAMIASAADQHRLVVAERELLDKTLLGSVAVLTDVLALVSPVAFARAVRLKRLVTELADALDETPRWPIELAAMLSELGMITVPPDVLQRYYRGQTLGASERDMISGAPNVADLLIGHVPRLEPVRAILRAQRAPFADAEPPVRRVTDEAAPIGAHLLQLAADFDSLEVRGDGAAACLGVIQGRAGAYDARALEALQRLKGSLVSAAEVRELALSDVLVGMVFERDVVAANGLVLIGRGQEATPSLVRRIRNFWSDLPLKDVPRVLIPANALQAEADALSPSPSDG